MFIKKGDMVQVISGDSKGTTGKVLKVLVKEQKVVVEGVNKVSRHTRPNNEYPEGGIIQKEAPIDISNVMLMFNGKATRVGFKMDGDKKVRYAKSTGEVIDKK